MCGKLDVNLRSCSESWWALQRARQLYSMTMWLWMMGVPRAWRTSQEFVAFFRKHRASVKDFSSAASFIDGDMDVYELDFLAATVSRCTSALEFSSEWPGCQRFNSGESRPPQEDQKKGLIHLRIQKSLEQEALAHNFSALLSILRCDFAC